MNPGFVKQAVPPVKARKLTLKCHNHKEGSPGADKVVAEAGVLGKSSAVPAALPVSSPAAAAGVPAMPTASPAAVPRTATPAASAVRRGVQETGKDGTIKEMINPSVDAVERLAAQNVD
ncbi:hypothetical protein EOD39_8978 [Acipenser ruthenus]|uniref:Uncharacterized protein n=1 Tax=Acipenser ruthenus TaxID=7906 RepID=A0A662YVB2_ACIRT|nr:hypothetical protein EOD39_8978 [Acipenser ruthenus]